jgi:hypothetical protein
MKQVARDEVLTAASVKMVVFWDVAPCRLVGIRQQASNNCLPLAFFGTAVTSHVVLDTRHNYFLYPRLL